MMIAYILIAFGFLMRIVPHVHNFAPVAAIALFSGAYLDKRIVPWVPLAIMIASDLIIGLHGVVFYTWGSFILIGFIGMWMKERRTPANIFLATVLSAALFFIITNFGVWLAWYPHTWEGLSSCYVRAIPFFRNTLLGNLFFALVLFGSYELARKIVGQTRFRAVLLTD
jgi:ABC-type proline/glycine betaine transport system permease subunit